MHIVGDQPGESWQPLHGLPCLRRVVVADLPGHHLVHRHV